MFGISLMSPPSQLGHPGNLFCNAVSPGKSYVFQILLPSNKDLNFIFEDSNKFKAVNLDVRKSIHPVISIKICNRFFSICSYSPQRKFKFLQWEWSTERFPSEDVINFFDQFLYVDTKKGSTASLKRWPWQICKEPYTINGLKNHITHLLFGFCYCFCCQVSLYECYC